MANVLKDEKKQQIIAWDDWDGLCERSKRPRECVERPSGPICEPQVCGNMATGKMETRSKAKRAIPVITASEAAKPAIPDTGGHPKLNPTPNPKNFPTKGKATVPSKPAIAAITDFGVRLSGQEPEDSKAVGSASTCEAYREIIKLGLSRVAMPCHRQDLVSDYGFESGYQSVRRFAYKFARPSPLSESLFRVSAHTNADRICSTSTRKRQRHQSNNRRA
jgi:hypothetical protein